MGKHKYDLQELNTLGIQDLESLIEDAHRRYVSKTLVKDNDAYMAHIITRYLVDNNICSIRKALDFVFENNLWSAWRRGQSTFKDLIRENDYIKRQQNS